MTDWKRPQMQLRSYFLRTLIILFLSDFLVTGATAQEDNSTLPPEPKQLVTLRALQANLESAKKELDERQDAFQEAQTVVEKDNIASEINALNARITTIETDLESIAAGVDVQQIEDNLSATIDLTAEFRELVQPIIQELKRATAKPRELEQLRNAITFHERRKQTATKALTHVRDLIAESKDEKLTSMLREKEASWEARLEEFSNTLTSAEYQLDEKERSDDSLLATVSEGAATFFRTRGKNILIALLAVVSVFCLLRLIHSFVRKMKMFRGRGKSFGTRLLDVIYYAVTIVLSIAAWLFAFYAQGDWMLLGLSMLVIAGMVWTSKTTLPGVFEQAKLMLNLGSVREGELLVYNDVPWQVKRVSIFTDLVNPALEGGDLRLPLRDLIPLNSRPFSPKEPFFPSEMKQWVLLADGTLGKVIHQTPEWVQLVLLGGAIKTYTISDFVGQTPLNLSRGFRLSVTFGIDYNHQEDATDVVPELLRARIENDLATLITSDHLVSLKVEFATAGASSLDYSVIADFSSEVAEKYFFLQRAIQRICVDACNEHGWVIPFTQITMHQATTPSDQDRPE